MSKKITYNIGIDAEWCYSSEATPISYKGDELTQTITREIKQAKVLSVQLCCENDNETKYEIYQHWDSYDLYKPFGDIKRSKYSNILHDFLGVTEVRQEINPKNYETINLRLHMFYAVRDALSLFKEPLNLLQLLSRKRRATIENYGRKDVQNVDGMQIKYRNNWYNLTIEIVDICAMQGIGSLKEYASNVGIIMKDKERIEDKSNMLKYYTNFEYYNDILDYAKGDVCYIDENGMERSLLPAIKQKTENYYRYLCEDILKMSLPDNFNFGLTTGKTISTIFTEFMRQWISKKIGRELTSEELNMYTKPVSNEGFITTYVKEMNTGKKKAEENPYLTTVDGGRCVRGTMTDSYIGRLADWDIKSCYGGGLALQTFPLGHPDTMTQHSKEDRENIPFLTFLRKIYYKFDTYGTSRPIYKNGCWSARISWKGADFKQDLLLSKEIRNFLEENDDGFTIFTSNKIELADIFMDASSLCFITNEVHKAVITSDLLELLFRVTNQKEKNFLFKNATVSYFHGFKNKNLADWSEFDKIFAQFKKRDKCDKAKAPDKWFAFPISEFINPLLAERKKTKNAKKLATISEEKALEAKDTFLKLCINTLYGVIASPYFVKKTTLTSNPIVGNNITARPRAITWMMEKALGTHVSITDGGISDIDCAWEIDNSRMSLDNYFKMRYEVELKREDARHRITKKISLLSSDHPFFDSLNTEQELEKIGYEHLCSQFPNLWLTSKDDFDNPRFTFEIKSLAESVVYRGKADYKIIRHIKKTIEIKDEEGNKKALKDENGNPIQKRIYESDVKLRGLGESYEEKAEQIITHKLIHSNKKISVDIERPLSLKEAKELLRKNIYALPGDELILYSSRYSNTPKHLSYKTCEDYKKSMNEYNKILDSPLDKYLEMDELIQKYS